MTKTDLVYEDFFEAFMGKIGVIEGTDRVVKVIAVRLPSDKSCIEPVIVDRPEISRDADDLILFPAGAYQGVTLSYVPPHVSLRSI